MFFLVPTVFFGVVCTVLVSALGCLALISSTMGRGGVDAADCRA